MRQLILDLLPEALPSLENFVQGSNQETFAALLAWLSPASLETMFFLSGESGSGKTHLLRASARLYLDAQRDPALSGLDSSTLGAEHLEPSADSSASPAFCYGVDHLEALDAVGQIALFNLFNRLRAQGGRLLVAARVVPRHLKLREDLRTRLASGLVYGLQPLSDAEKISALSAQAAARGLNLSSEALNYVLARAPRDMRSLSAFLASLDAYSLQHKRPVTLPLLREILQIQPGI
ncbi:MAG: DnaA regulatory inactivator Hda [Pseudomonadota bacterium]